MHSSFRAAALAAFFVSGLGACVPRYSSVEVADMLSKGSVEVEANTSRNAVNVVTRGQTTCAAIMSGNGGIAGVLIGAAIVAASAEPEIPNIANVTQPIADGLQKKFRRPDASAQNFYKVLVAGGGSLTPAMGDHFQLTYTVGMNVTNIKTQEVVMIQSCAETEASTMPLAKWRESVPLILALRGKTAATCSAKFKAALSL